MKGFSILTPFKFIRNGVENRNQNKKYGGGMGHASLPPPRLIAILKFYKW